jgi:hypothetical protein
MIIPRFRAAFRGLGLLTLIALMSACASGPTIITNSDPSADFMSLKTFDFMKPLSTDRGDVQSLLSTQMIAATTLELEKLGMRHEQNNPDVLINFMLETTEQIRSRPATASMSMHRGGRYSMWGTTVSTAPTIEQSTQGVLSVDMVDPRRNQLIWEGSATHRVTDGIRRNQEEAVNSFVADIFAEFP